MNDRQPAPAALEINAARIAYGTRATIGPVSAQVRPGGVLGLVGPNGSGKTSIMRAVCALWPLDGGSVSVRGAEVVAGVPVAGLGAIVEEPQFFPWLSGRQNLDLCAAGREDWRRRSAAVLEDVGLERVADTPVGQYSQGMRQRLGLARALLGDPSLLVLDEPTNGLDIDGIARIRVVVREAARRGAAVVISSHMSGEIEALADSVLIMRAGQVLAYESLEAIADRAGSVAALYESLVVPADDRAR